MRSREINQNTRIIRLIRPRERNQRPWTSTPTPGNLHLATPEIELRAANIPSIMQRNLLNPQQIIPIRQRRRKINKHLLLPYSRISLNPRPKEGGKKTNP